MCDKWCVTMCDTSGASQCAHCDAHQRVQSLRSGGNLTPNTQTGLLRADCRTPHTQTGANPKGKAAREARNLSGDATPCRMTGVTLHSHVRYKENLEVFIQGLVARPRVLVEVDPPPKLKPSRPRLVPARPKVVPVTSVFQKKKTWRSASRAWLRGPASTAPPPPTAMIYIYII